MNEIMRDIICSQSLFKARLSANNGDNTMLQWYDGRLSSLNLLWPDNIEIQGAYNEARFLCHYTSKHFKG